MRIIFSRRGGMRYIDFRKYLEKISRQSRIGALHISSGDLVWSVMDLDEIEALNHKDRAGLQLADIVASAFFQSVENNRPASCDPTYAKLLKPRVARNNQGRYIDLGIKTMPALHDMGLSVEQREIFEFYGYNPGGW